MSGDYFIPNHCCNCSTMPRRKDPNEILIGLVVRLTTLIERTLNDKMTLETFRDAVEHDVRLISGY